MSPKPPEAASTSDFDYELPEELIAQEAAPRGESRLLVLARKGPPVHERVRDLVGRLRPGDLLVLNDTRVLAARLHARTESGGRIELLLLERRSDREWTALVKPGRKARPGRVLRLERRDHPEGGGPGVAGPGPGEVVVEVVSREEDVFLLRSSEPLEPVLDDYGHVPLPPYIRRPDRDADRERYQTLWARVPGAVAAPTAGLHFDQALLDALRGRGVEIATLTLHVGAGTFRPVAVEDPDEHQMHQERYSIPDSLVEAVERCRARRGRVVAVGTTVVRALEASAREAQNRSSERPLVAGPARTDLFLRPGADFLVVDALVTNFHLPRSTLLMLVCAFSGRDRVLDAYREAVVEGYRFFSYGDAMFLERT